MPFYQGRALWTRRPRRPSRLRRVVAGLVLLGAAGIVAVLPWREMRRRWAVVSHVRVVGLHYLDAGHVQKIAGIRIGDDLLELDLERVRQTLMLSSRVSSARVTRSGLRGIRIAVEERVPVLLVQHGVPWEVDSTGVLLAPLEPGVVADVPRLVGPDFARMPAGAQVRGTEVERGLQWVRALGRHELQLAGQVSEVDVTQPQETRLALLSGVRVVAPAWPPSLPRLSALRVVLADLLRKGTLADEVDLRFEDQVIVRPMEPPPADHQG